MLAVEDRGGGNGKKKSNYDTIFSSLCFSSQNNLKREKKRKRSAIDRREYIKYCSTTESNFLLAGFSSNCTILLVKM